MKIKGFIAPIFAGALVFGLGGVAQADEVYYDMCAGNAACLAALTGGVDGWADTDGDEGSGANSTSELFEQFAVHAETRTTQFDTDGNGVLSDGDKFSDFGHLNITNIVPGGGGDNEGLNSISGFQMTAGWNGLTGTASHLVPGSTPGTLTSNIVYDTTGNATFDFYVDDRSGGPATRTNFNYGAANAVTGASDDTNFTDGVKVLSVQIVGGFGTNTFDALGNFLTGSSTLNGIVTFALDDFLFFANSGLDFADLVGSAIDINVFIDQNTANVHTIPCPGNPACQPGAIFVVDSDHDGSIVFHVVPEPASVLMFGIGFMAVGCATLVARRRNA